jgi:anthranilate 1,2-dioxygenase small subunit/terephthalate 1,2-dioxygenase oxygenase component beta subunit
MDQALHSRIQELCARYAHTIDDDRLEEWPELFTGQGRYIVTTADNFEQGLPLGLIYATSRAMIRDRVKSLREANIYEAQRYRHVVGTPLITEAADGMIGARSSFLVVRIMHTGESVLFATGVYRDRIELGPDGAPRFAERIVVLDSRQIDTLLAIPL